MLLIMRLGRRLCLADILNDADVDLNNYEDDYVVVYAEVNGSGAVLHFANNAYLK